MVMDGEQLGWPSVHLLGSSSAVWSTHGNRRESGPLVSSESGLPGVPGTHGQGGELTPTATKLPRPGGSRGEQTVESLFSPRLQVLGTTRELGAANLDVPCLLSTQPAARRASTRCCVAVAAQPNACSPVPSSALWNNRFVRDEHHRLCIGAVICCRGWLQTKDPGGESTAN